MKQAVSLHWDSASRTHVGTVRKLNEDSVLERPDRGLWAVADGMGGYAGGEVASAVAVQTVAELVARHGGTVSGEHGDGLARSIVFDMERIAGLMHSYHIPVIWYNYPWPRHFPRVLQTIASTGARLGIPVLQAEKDYAIGVQLDEEPESDLSV